jgi:hypothetical protein
MEWCLQSLWWHGLFHENMPVAVTETTIINNNPVTFNMCVIQYNKTVQCTVTHWWTSTGFSASVTTVVQVL